VVIAYDKFVSIFFRACYTMIAVVSPRPSNYEPTQLIKAGKREGRLWMAAYNHPNLYVRLQLRSRHTETYAEGRIGSIVTDLHPARE